MSEFPQELNGSIRKYNKLKFHVDDDIGIRDILRIVKLIHAVRLKNVNEVRKIIESHRYFVTVVQFSQFVNFQYTTILFNIRISKS